MIKQARLNEGVLLFFFQLILLMYVMDWQHMDFLCGASTSLKSLVSPVVVVTKLVNRGYQPHLEDFLLRINFNNYYKET